MVTRQYRLTGHRITDFLPGKNRRDHLPSLKISVGSLVLMPGAEPPESAWYVLDRMENWMQLFDINEDEISLILGPRVDRETGDWQMDIYARYEGSRDMDVHWDASIDYSRLDLSYTEMMEEYQLWRDRFDEELEEADKFYRQFTE
ncbi:hypothetical protein ACM16X_02305 [Haloarcula japonica]|uniref:hypothetical protein n=1 Tax=Haloarcula japonica TaxID=29282 RepID=UPI0039F73BDD